MTFTDLSRIYLDIAGVMIVVLDSDQKVVLINKKGCSILGYKPQEMMGRNWFDLVIPEEARPKVKETFNLLLRGKIKPVEHYENPVVTKNGKLRMIEWHNTVVKDAKGNVTMTVSSGTDVTEKNKLLGDIAHSNRDWEVTFNSIKDAVAVINSKNVILRVNKAMLKFLGRPLDKVVGKKCFDLVHKGIQPLDCPFKKLNQLQTRQSMALEISGRIYEVSVDPIFAGKELTGAVHIISDITERKFAEKHINKLYSLVLAIRNVNQALVSIKDEPTLYHQICLALEDVPGMKFVWIGLAQKDGSVKPVAWVGEHKEALRQMEEIAKSGMTEEALSITSGAIKTGRTEVVGDMHREDKTRSFRSIASRIGAVSGIAVPIKFENKVIGNLTAYSEEKDAFGTEEVAFFEEVAGDVGVGLKSLEAEKQIRKLYSIVLAIRNVNQALVSIKDEESLYEQICVALKDVPGLMFAWVGRVTPDGRVHQKAWAGTICSNKKFIKQFRTSKMDISGLNITGSAMQQNKTVVLQDIDKISPMPQYLGILNAVGVRSAIAVPVKVGGKLIGNLTAYFNDPDMFGPDEISFFEEVAGDMGIGLNSIEMEGNLEHLASFPKLNPSPIFEMDGTGKVIFANDSAKRAFPGIEKDGAEHSFIREVMKRLKSKKLVQLEENAGGKTYLASASRVKDGATIRVYCFDITARKNAEFDLKASEGTTRQVINSLPMGIHMYRLEAGNRLYFTGSNDSADKILGVKNSDFIGKYILDAFPDLKGSGVPEIYAKVARTGKAWHSEQINYKDKQISGAFDVYAFRTAPGRMAAIFEDITKRKQAEIGVKESEERFKSLFETSPDGVVLTGLDGSISMANKKFLNIFRYKDIEEITGNKVKILSVIAPQDRERAIADRGKTAKVGGLLVENYTGLRKDGSQFSLEINRSVLKDAQGKVQGIIGVVRDVTERKRAEQALKDSEARYRLVADNLSDVIWTIDKELNYSYVSPSYFLRRGFKPENVIGKPLKLFMQPETFERLRETMTEMMALAEVGDLRAWVPRRIEGEYKTKDGGTAWGETVINILRDEAKRPAGFVGITSDISDRKRLESQLIQSQKMEAVGQLAAGVSHEFNNLLAVIQLSVEEAVLKHTDAAFESMAKEVLATTKQAAMIARRLNDFAKKHRMENHLVDLRKCVDIAVEMMEKDFRRSRISIKRVYGDCPLTFTDDRLLLQVFLNLFKNAEHAMQKGGNLTVSVGCAGINIIISVKDTGVGIQPENMEKLFTPFYTTKGAFGSGEQQGVGLGLAVSYSIVKRLGGDITVESKEGKGATFTVTIPINENEGEPVTGEAITRVGKVLGRKILVIDDERAIRSLLQKILGSSGYSVETAKDGVEALAKMPEFMPEVVLLDIIMHETDTEGLIRELREKYPLVKIIAVTGIGDAELEKWRPVLTSYGINHIVLKPFDFARLKIEIEKCYSKE